MQTPSPIVLTIAGSDPSGGAGIEADLKVFHAHGVYGTAVATLYTVQNTVGVRKVRFADSGFMEEQLRALLEDLRPSVIKIGAVGSRATVQALARVLRGQSAAGIPIILDPILQASSGPALFESSALPDFQDRLLPLANIITPNLQEFALLSGHAPTPAGTVASLESFAANKPYAVLLKGGHMEGDTSVDFLWDRGRCKSFSSRRIRTQQGHGTGCALSSAIAARLAKGESLERAVEKAKAYVHAALATAPGLGQGRGPLNFFTPVPD
jgi:hydroxymethylpyrimidine/phosphomethylpyrimidine kinase